MAGMTHISAGFGQRGPDLNQISGKAYADKQAWLISFVLDDRGNKLALSRYGDAVWELKPFYPVWGVSAKSASINFASHLFGDGSRLTSPQHGKLLESVKDYLYLLLGKVDVSTLCKSKWHCLQPLLRWMVESQGYEQFGTITNPIDYVPVARQRRRRLHGRGRDDGNNEVGAWMFAKRLSVVEDLWKYREELTDHLPRNPWPRRSANRLAGCSRRCKAKTLAIPDDVFRPLMGVALSYVYEKSTRILAARRAADQARQKVLKSGYTHDHATIIATRAVRHYGFHGLEELGKEEVWLRTSCYIAVAGFVGPRRSEVLSLRRKCAERTQIRVGDEHYDAVYIHGRTFKGSPNKAGEPARWMANDDVETAIGVLEALSVPLQKKIDAEIAALEAIPDDQRSLAQTQQLNAARVHRDGLFLGTGKSSWPVRVLNESTSNHYLKRLCAHFNIADRDGNVWPLHSHQFRRTLARFIARSRLGNPVYLQHHFKHWSSSLTWYYMQGEVDRELINYADEEYMNYVRDLYDMMLKTDTPLAGGRGRYIEEHRDFLAYSNLRALAQLMPEDMRLKAQPHSMCMTPKDEPFCGPECLYNPILCVSCDKAVITSEHLPIWYDLAARQREILALDNLGDPQRADAEETLVQIEALIRYLEGMDRTKDAHQAIKGAPDGVGN